MVDSVPGTNGDHSAGHVATQGAVTVAGAAAASVAIQVQLQSLG